MDGLCFNIEIDITGFNAPCYPSIKESGWFDDAIDDVSYHADIVHCHVDEKKGEWIDYLAPARIFTRIAYVVLAADPEKPEHRLMVH